MSQNLTIDVEIIDIEFLKQALVELKYPFEEGRNLRLHGYLGDVRSETADIVVRREYIGHVSNDIGFLKTNKGNYQVIISEFDLKGDFLKKVKQKYTELKIKKEVSKQGYKIVSEEKLSDGSMKLSVKRWL